MKTIKGPAIFLAQYISDQAPFDTIDHLAKWASDLGYIGIQIPVDYRLIDIQAAAESKEYCNDLKKRLANYNIVITELSTHLQGQLIAVHPAYDQLFDGFAPSHVQGNPNARRAWAEDQLKLAAKASHNLGLTTHVTFSGALAWPYVYPWPQRPANLVETAFSELGKRWLPILDEFHTAGVDVCYELHPGEDLHDGVTFERFLKEVDFHPRANILFDPSHFLLQQLDYLAFIDIYHKRIKAFHVKDAEFRPDGRQGVYGGYSNWVDRAGRFRSLGDGQIDFKGIFTKLAQYDYPGWAVLESECAIKHPEACAVEGASFITQHIIKVTDHEFDDFAQSSLNDKQTRQLLGL
ncbi:xylose isomerase domain protein TIM barrel [Umbelopsis sp. PMI_123]|nr:xylose isomerase domain protein TIM barrel [Umbelopsis sp. PMI_123]